MTNPNDPAYPTFEEFRARTPDETIGHFHGLTKREYFAAMAMQGYISRGSDRMQDHAVNDADALIKELSK